MMKQTPLRPPSLTAVLVEVAELSPESFKRLIAEIDGPNAFDYEQERVATLVQALGKDEDTISAILSTIGFLYQRIHRSSKEIPNLKDIVKDIVTSLPDQENLKLDERPDDAKVETIVDRLTELLRPQTNVDKFAKHERLRWGFLPAANSFASFVDLRPSLSDDLSAVEEFIPIIQFRVKTDSAAPMLKNFVFQLDPRNLKRLKSEIERAEQKLATIISDERLSNMMTKRRS